jgi:sec-independent protein translocase protein TatC
LKVNPQAVVRFLERLRWRLVWSLVFLAAGSVLGYLYAPLALQALLSQGEGLEQLVFLSPGEAFFARLKLGVALGGALALPFIMQQLVGAAMPWVPAAARKAVYIALPCAYLLFIGGTAFACFGVLPLALRFFLSFSSPHLEPVISVGNFVDFAIMFALPFGFVFQLPVLILMLARCGWLRAEALARRRKYAVLVIAIVAAVITPADLFSMLCLALPMVLLYEVSIFLARFWAQRQAR